MHRARSKSHPKNEKKDFIKFLASQILENSNPAFFAKKRRTN